jgi:3-ketosteroid 9alpha-monooxygenase subunit A
MPKPQRFPMGIPYGWYFIGYSDELAPGDVRHHHYFGRDLVIFRNEHGVAGLLDAYCPHLGAHLGHGGQVKGDSIHCPFHGWSYRPDGFCSGIPYAKVMPAITQRQAVIHAYPLTEANGIIWGWYHPANIAPLFEVEVYPEFTDPGWVKQIRFEWRCAINPQEVGENGVDVAHFQFVHTAKAVPEGFSHYDGHRRKTGSDGWRDVELPSGETKRIATSVRTSMNGPGQKITILSGVTSVALMTIVTPIEAEDAELRFCFTHREAEPGSQAEADYEQAVASISGPNGVLADLPIWHNKIHRARPILCDGDGPILRFRQYFEQFYVPESAPERVAAE